jgi:hypothetical protein
LEWQSKELPHFEGSWRNEKNQQRTAGSNNEVLTTEDTLEIKSRNLNKLDVRNIKDPRPKQVEVGKMVEGTKVVVSGNRMLTIRIDRRRLPTRT